MFSRSIARINADFRFIQINRFQKRLFASDGSNGDDDEKKKDDADVVSNKQTVKSPFDFLNDQSYNIRDGLSLQKELFLTERSIFNDNKGMYESLIEKENDVIVDEEMESVDDAMERLSEELNRSSSLRLEPSLRRDANTVFPDLDVSKLINTKFPELPTDNEEENNISLNVDDNNQYLNFRRRDMIDAKEEIRRLQSVRVLPPPPFSAGFGEEALPIDDIGAPNDRLVNPQQFDFMGNRPRTLAPGEVSPWIKKCRGRKQGKSGYMGRCEIFNEFDLHFQNIPLLKRFLSPSSMIMPRRRTGLCTRCQRKVARMVKRARQMGSIPFNGSFNVTDSLASITHVRARSSVASGQSLKIAKASKFKSLSWDRERGLE